MLKLVQDMQMAYAYMEARVVHVFEASVYLHNLRYLHRDCRRYLSTTSSHTQLQEYINVKCSEEFYIYTLHPENKFQLFF